MTAAIHSCRTRRRPASRQRGVVLIFTLIALVVMMIASVALVRSFNSSLTTAGNIAFKRDLTNQSDLVVPAVLNLMQTGALGTPAARAATVQASNYSASILPSNAQGIPLILLRSDADFNTQFSTANDMVLPTQKVVVRYVVDRLCDGPGLDSTLGADHCNTASDAAPVGGTGSLLQRAERNAGGGAGAVPLAVIYRLSIRVSGPRNTQSFFQTTFTL